MKKILVVFLIVAGCAGMPEYKVTEYLTPQQQDQVMSQVIRYLAKPPEGLTFEERFYDAYTSYYNEQQGRHRLDAYYIDENNNHFFLISRPAPSLVEKRVATGGKVKFSNDFKKIEDYEEVFRTWKMVPDTLKVRSLLLFDHMVKGKSIDPYLTKNSNGVEYIEFPDDQVYFDKTARQWRAK